jgi:histidine triad (HIT) family protein
MDCLFCKIAAGTIPSKAFYQDGEFYAFADINPQAPVHFLVIPREHIASIATAGSSHTALIGRLFLLAAQIAADQGLQKGYRLVVNTGKDGGQTVDHLHIHVLGGRHCSWPPG